MNVNATSLRCSPCWLHSLSLHCSAAPRYNIFYKLNVYVIMKRTCVRQRAFIYAQLAWRNGNGVANLWPYGDLGLDAYYLMCLFTSLSSVFHFVHISANHLLSLSCQSYVRANVGVVTARREKTTTTTIVRCALCSCMYYGNQMR